jgi:hypothetical protein
MADPFFSSVHRASPPYIERRPCRLTEVVIQRNSRQENAGSRDYCHPIEFALEPQEGGALPIRTAYELLLTV